jgi:Flp pilus assembly protein TadG
MQTCSTNDTRRLDHLARHWMEDEQGANLVEAAFILPLILLVICSLMEFSGVLYTRMALQNGVSQATRFAITRAILTGKSREESIKAVLRRRTPRITLDDSNIAFSHRLPGGRTWDAGTGPPRSIERLTVTYKWHVMTPVMARFFPADGITIVAESAMKNEQDPRQ